MLDDVLKGKTKEEIKSLKRREHFATKMIDKGLTSDDVKRMDIKTFNKTFGTKKKKKSSLLSEFRIIDQINLHIKDVSNYHIQKHQITNDNKIIFEQQELRRLVQQEGQYSIVELRYKDESKYIKFENERSLREQLDKLKDDYGKEFQVLFYDFKTYAEFINRQFNKIVKSKGVKI